MSNGEQTARGNLQISGMATSPKLNDELVARLVELQGLVKCWHVDMGGKDKYTINPRNYDRIGKLIDECLYLAESN